LRSRRTQQEQQKRSSGDFVLLAEFKGRRFVRIVILIRPIGVYEPQPIASARYFRQREHDYVVVRVGDEEQR
jgi:hypothetical protein